VSGSSCSASWFDKVLCSLSTLALVESSVASSITASLISWLWSGSMSRASFNTKEQKCKIVMKFQSCDYSVPNAHKNRVRVSFRVLVMQYIQRCGNRRGLERDYMYRTLAKKGPWAVHLHWIWIGGWADIPGISVAVTRERAPR
jgi:hypothetical protein